MLATNLRVFAVAVCMAACSCGESQTAPDVATQAGGAQGTAATGNGNGGVSQAGAASVTGGASATGGASNRAGSGGATNTGGSIPVAGGNNAGGAAGATGAGGSTGAGGATSGGATGAGGSAAGGAVGTGGATSGDIATEPNLKIGFIGDTHTDTNFTNVLNLVKSEGASALVVEGDMSYSADPPAWWNALESVLGTTYPVFISRGNHDDSSWSGYLPTAANHLGGATREAGAHDSNYKTTYKGLVIATIKKGDTGSNITPFLQGDAHIWKICNWHQNQQAMQIGGKGDEMGWDVYETCRQLGAIIQTGHEHSYERTKTLTNAASQTVDASCAGATALCVGPGRTFVSVVGLGGNSVRDQTRCLPSTPPYGCNGEWGFVYTNQQSATYGAQFITFNAGDAKTATGYFKNVNGQTVDTFTIHHD
jgi:predicted phosphodiesterase